VSPTDFSLHSLLLWALLKEQPSVLAWRLPLVFFWVAVASDVIDVMILINVKTTTYIN
jgi:hypothetical protein